MSKLPNIQTWLPILCCSLLLGSCATYKTKISPKAAHQSAALPPSAQLDQVVFLIGDAGKLHEGEAPPVLKQVASEIDKSALNHSLVYLGDNIYPLGMPTKDDPDRSTAEANLDAQIEVMRDMMGTAVLIPGNHDWYNDGLKGLARQEKYVKKHLDKKNVFLPEDGCPGPELIKLSEHLHLIILDTEWLIEDYAGRIELDPSCEVSHYNQFPAAFNKLLNKSQAQTVLVCLHHPMASYGSHGGHFSAKSHFFPVSEFSKKALIPLPILGSLGHLLRIDGGQKEDVTGQAMRWLQQHLRPLIENHGKVILASGHDHNLQLIDMDGVHQIVSGAGTKQTPTRIGGQAEFTTGQMGYARLKSYTDGSVRVEFVTVGEDGVHEAYAKMLFQADEHFDITNLSDALEENYRTSIYSGDDKQKFHRSIFGDWYRSLYYEPIVAPTLDLSSHLGGLTPVRKGGGFQTNSLRLEAKDGREYALRALHKDANRLTGGVFDETVVLGLVEDFFTVSHPYAAFSISPMADALGLYHTTPELYYVPQQKALGDYNPKYGDQLFLLEERPDGKLWNGTVHFGESPEIVSTTDMTEAITSKYSHEVDGAFTIKARLFDHLIGDWDRHQDQWRWASIEQDDKTLYRPIPRDRDQAYSKFDGLLTSIVKRTIPTVRKFQSFSPETKRLKWFNFNNRHVDRWYLNSLEWSDWEVAIREIETQLEESHIDAGLSRLPQNAQDFNGAEIKEFLLKRQENMDIMARKYYEILARDVDVLGTEKKDHFVISYAEDFTLVERFKYKGDKDKELLYSRRFYDDETKRIFLWGLEGEDLFTIQGEGKGPKLTILGGRDPDDYEDLRPPSSRAVRVYDKTTSSQIHPEASISLRGLPDKSYYVPDWNERQYDYGLGLPLPAANNEDGFGLGYNYTYTDYGFKKAPYKSQHQVKASYIFQTRAWSLSYETEWNHLIGKTDLLYGLSYHGPTWNLNFFGLGNQSAYDPKEDDISFHRVRQERIHGDLGLQRDYISPWRLGLGVSYDSYRLRENDGRFIETPLAQIPDYLEEWKGYLSASTWAIFDYIDDELRPKRGIGFVIRPSYISALGEEGGSFVDIKTSLTIHHPLTLDQRLRYAGKLAYHAVGDGYEFFQAPAIGRLEGVRGLRQGRYRGDASLAWTNDLYFDLLSVMNVGLPFELGLIASADIGRVWVESEKSELWHPAVGGGLSLDLLKMLKISASYHISRDDQILIVGLGRRIR